MQILESPLPLRIVHGAEEKQLLSVRFEIVGAFAHAVHEDAIFLGREQPPHERPCKKIKGAEEKQIASLPVANARDAVKNALSFKHFGIAEIAPRTPFGEERSGNDGVGSRLFEHDAVFGNGKALLLYLFCNTRVHQNELPFVLQRRARKAPASAVIVLIGRERHGQKFPADEIGRDKMPPMHALPIGMIGIVLAKKMRLSAEEDEPVRVVRPTHGNARMIARAIAPLCFAAVFFEESICPLDRLFHPSLLKAFASLYHEACKTARCKSPSAHKPRGYFTLRT